MRPVESMSRDRERVMNGGVMKENDEGVASAMTEQRIVHTGNRVVNESVILVTATDIEPRGFCNLDAESDGAAPDACRFDDTGCMQRRTVRLNRREVRCGVLIAKRVSR